MSGRSPRGGAQASQRIRMGEPLMQTTVVVIAMGEMGAGIAKRLTSRGAQVRTSLKDRGEGSARRAREAGVEIFDDERALVDGADFILSVVPPAAARALAERLAPALQAVVRKPIYVDCNAVSPATVQAVAATLAPTGCAFADCGILGFPPKENDAGPRIYLSGPAAAQVAGLTRFGLDLRVLDERIGSASALKCSYAALGKGLTALGSLLILGAQRSGVDAALRNELATYQPQILAWLRRMVPDMYGKSYRWVAEMEEIAAFLDATPGGGATYRGIARLFEWMAEAAPRRGTAGNDIDALDSFLTHDTPDPKR
jgi:3-hydroxyisobutyrate dehydrogenase-like beta-hydroxyacid dehydrogenase